MSKKRSDRVSRKARWVASVLSTGCIELDRVLAPYEVGHIKNCKIGDVEIELCAEHVAAGARIVVEAKEDASYKLKDRSRSSNRRGRTATLGSEEWERIEREGVGYWGMANRSRSRWVLIAAVVLWTALDGAHSLELLVGIY